MDEFTKGYEQERGAQSYRAQHALKGCVVFSLLGAAVVVCGVICCGLAGGLFIIGAGKQQEAREAKEAMQEKAQRVQPDLEP